MATGVVKWFNQTKGYGFISQENGGKEVFVHISELERAGIRELDKGQKVSYELSTNNKGNTYAVQIKLI